MSRHVHVLRVAPIIAGTLCAAASVDFAKAQAAVPDATRPAPAQGNWWDNPAPPPGRPPQQQGPLFRHDTGGYGFADYPSMEMHDWVVANAMAARARAMLNRAESELNTTFRRTQSRFEHSEEYSKAAMADKLAYADYVAARQKVLNTLGGDAKYHAIMQLRDELAEKITERRAAKDVSRDEILAMATLKMQYASDARAIETAALSADDNLKAARDKMVDTSRKLSDLKAQFEYAIHDNPELIIARRNLEDARIGVVEACALAQGAAISSNYAVNYSYYLHRNDNGGQYGPYGPNGIYGSYTTPYWGR
jgi:hypothetical protein